MRIVRTIKCDVRRLPGSIPLRRRSFCSEEDAFACLREPFRAESSEVQSSVGPRAVRVQPHGWQRATQPRRQSTQRLPACAHITVGNDQVDLVRLAWIAITVDYATSVESRQHLAANLTFHRAALERAADQTKVIARRVAHGTDSQSCSDPISRTFEIP